ncbi:MAG: MBL fold metallo-hydrolase [Bacteroidales bacterium]|nr:MBL fold metallo-hydrolase [Bacteroidales bacterium]
MKNLVKFLSVLTLLAVSIMSYSQTMEIKIRFIGNCGLYMTDGNTNIYVDFPYKSGAHNYMEYDLSELDSVKINPVFIYTHKHSDHFAGKVVKKLAKRLSGDIYSPWNIEELVKLNNKIKDFTIEVFKTKHRFSINHYSYLITWHNKRIFISGDTGNVETMSTLKDIDWAFMPFWILLDANEKGIKLKDVSKMFAIYHIGPDDKIINASNDSRIKLLNKQGEIILIPCNL